MVTQKRYKCNRCNFSWTPKTDDIPKRCPYCSKSDGIETPTADARFSDIDDLLA